MATDNNNQQGQQGIGGLMPSATTQAGTSVGVGNMASTQVPAQTGPPQSEEDLQRRKEGWKGIIQRLQEPDMQQFLLGFGSRLMQPVPVGGSASGQIGSGVLQGSQMMLAEQQRQKNEEARQKQLGLKERQVKTQEEGVDLRKTRQEHGMEMDEKQFQEEVRSNKTMEDLERLRLNLQKQREQRLSQEQQAGGLDPNKLLNLSQDAVAKEYEMDRQAVELGGMSQEEFDSKWSGGGFQKRVQSLYDSYSRIYIGESATGGGGQGSAEMVRYKASSGLPVTGRELKMLPEFEGAEDIEDDKVYRLNPQQGQQGGQEQQGQGASDVSTLSPDEARRRYNSMLRDMSDELGIDIGALDKQVKTAVSGGEETTDVSDPGDALMRWLGRWGAEGRNVSEAQDRAERLRQLTELQRALQGNE